MKINTVVLDEAFEIVFRGTTLVNAHEIVKIAAERSVVALQKGEKWTRGAISYMAEELIKEVQREVLGKSIDKSAMELALVTWVYELNFCGLDVKTFVSSDLVFTMSHNGIVKYDHTIKGAQNPK